MKKAAVVSWIVFSAIAGFSMEPDAWFRTVDKDKDGKASQAEWLAKNKADAERNGKTVKENIVVEKFKARDLDKDGFLSLEEFLSTRGK